MRKFVTLHVICTVLLTLCISKISRDSSDNSDKLFGTMQATTEKQVTINDQQCPSLFLVVGAHYSYFEQSN